MSPILGIYASQISGHLVTNSYYSIATQTVGSGGASSITFSSIPSTYTHLQIRSFAQQASSGGYVSVTFDNATFAYRHFLYGSGSSALAGADTTNAPGIFSAAATSSTFSGSIFDILDYTSVNKNKVTRSLGGNDTNGGGGIYFMSGLFTSSSPITSITLTAISNNFTQYSSFALYGIK
jgi:hypothetical protein